MIRGKNIHRPIPQPPPLHSSHSTSSVYPIFWNVSSDFPNENPALSIFSSQTVFVMAAELRAACPKVLPLTGSAVPVNLLRLRFRKRFRLGYRRSKPDGREEERNDGDEETHLGMCFFGCFRGILSLYKRWDEILRFVSFGKRGIDSLCSLEFVDIQRWATRVIDDW